MFPACCFRQRTFVAQGLFTLVSSINEFCLVGLVFIRVFCAFFLECVYFGFLYSSLIFDMYISIYMYIYKYINICIYHHHHHHVVLVARISLTLSRHFSQSFIASGRSSGQHPVSSHSC